MRLFVAVWPDEAARAQLSALERELGSRREKGLGLVGASRWHVTLRFLGEVTEEMVPALGRALEAAAAAVPGPVSCRIGPETSWFTETRVLQLPVVGLDALAGAVLEATQSVVPAGKWDAAPFKGHLTLARLRGRRRVVGGAGMALAGLGLDAAFAVTSIDLVHSQPSPNGHVYTTLARATVGPCGGEDIQPDVTS